MYKVPFGVLEEGRNVVSSLLSTLDSVMNHSIALTKEEKELIERANTYIKLINDNYDV